MTRNLLDLPTEIHIAIIANLEDVFEEVRHDHDDVCYQPLFGEYQQYGGYESATGSLAIRNIRLVCKQLRAAAYESFATLLGMRRFTFANRGISDLKDIGAVQQLAPWVKTITLGCAPPKPRYVCFPIMLQEGAKYVDGEDFFKDTSTAPHVLVPIFSLFRNLEDIYIDMSSGRTNIHSVTATAGNV